MKNVKCRKLLIDRSKTPDKVGTLKDISLYGNFQFPMSGPNSGGLIARSLAGMGKEMKKTKVQIQGLANRTCPIAGATGPSTSEEICCEAASATPHTITSEEPYSVRFVQHAVAEQVLPVTMVPVEEEGIVTYAVNPGYALKVGGAKRVLFTLEQKEVMIEFYNRQAQYGIRADADDCIAEMKARGLNPLRKTQITSWWSSYHQKRRRGTERVAADLQQTPATTATTPPTTGSTASSTITATVSSAVSPMPATTSVIASAVPSATVMVSSTSSTHTAVTEGVSSTVNTFPVSTATVSSTMSTSQTASTMSSVVAASIPAVNVVPVVFAVPNCMVGNYVVPGVTEWYFPLNIAQSTIDNRNGSSACVFIAMNFGLLYKRCGLDTTLMGQSMNTQLQAVLEKAIRDGNQVHDELFDQEGVIVTVEEGIELAGDQCQVRQIYQEYNVFGTNPLNQLETVISSLLLQKFLFHVLVVNPMAMLIVVDSQGTLIFIDSHVHGSKGAVISRFIPDRDTQVRRFSLWLNAMLTQSSGLGVSICSISSISYS